MPLVVRPATASRASNANTVNGLGEYASRRSKASATRPGLPVATRRGLSSSSVSSARKWTIPGRKAIVEQSWPAGWAPPEPSAVVDDDDDVVPPRERESPQPARSAMARVVKERCRFMRGCWKATLALPAQRLGAEPRGRAPRVARPRCTVSTKPLLGVAFQGQNL